MDSRKRELLIEGCKSGVFICKAFVITFTTIAVILIVLISMEIGSADVLVIIGYVSCFIAIIFTVFYAGLDRELDSLKKMNEPEVAKNSEHSLLAKTAVGQKPNVFKDGFAFMYYQDARVVSSFNFPNGNPMSVRGAKSRGLIKGDI